MARTTPTQLVVVYDSTGYDYEHANRIDRSANQFHEITTMDIHGGATLVEWIASTSRLHCAATRIRSGFGTRELKHGKNLHPTIAVPARHGDGYGFMPADKYPGCMTSCVAYECPHRHR